MTTVKILVFFLAGAFVAVGSHAGEPVIADKDAPIYWQALKLDRLGNTRPVPGIPDAYVSPFGTQVHPSCFDYAARSGTPRAQAEVAVEGWLRETFQTMVSCESRYPEFKPYLQEWVSQFRRARITCTSKTMAQTKMSAQNMPLGMGVLLGLSENEREGIEIPDNLASLPREYRSVVILPVDSFALGIKSGAVKDSSGAWARDFIFHEVLHSTHANNRWDHDQVENKDPAATGCDNDNITGDRINVVSMLCTGSALVDDKSAEQVLFDRMSGCGAGKCVRLFAEDHYDTHDILDYLSQPWMPTEGLSQKNAEKLCQRIYNQGQCSSDLAAQGANLTKGAPKLRELGGKLRERLHHLFVPGAARIAPEVLAAIPTGKYLLEKRDTACFKDVFKLAPGGALYLREGASRVRSSGSSHELASPRRFFMDSQQAMSRAVAGSAACAGAEGRQLTRLLEDFGNVVDWSLFKSTAYTDFLARRYSGEAEANPTGFGPAFHFGSWEAVLGKGLVEEYGKAIELLHYQSSSVSCEALGYTGAERVTPWFTEVAKRVQMSSHGSNCKAGH